LVVPRGAVRRDSALAATTPCVPLRSVTGRPAPGSSAHRVVRARRPAV